MNGVFIGCVTKENADEIMAMQRLAYELRDIIVAQNRLVANWHPAVVPRLLAALGGFSQEEK
jgi:hypothetical protein